MESWNVVVTVHEGYYTSARKLLETLGPVRKTEFYNVLVMEVADVRQAMELFKNEIDRDNEARQAIARFVPAFHTFFFTNASEFEEKAKEVVLALAHQLHGKKFHVRMHRRGFKNRISSLEEETLLDKVLLEALQKKGFSGTISFIDPDAVIAIETVGQQAGLALFNREELARYPFLHID